MGLFDIFGKKKREEQEAAEMLKALFEYQIEATEGAVDTDDIPNGYGPFGLCKTNPVPIRSIPSSKEYLSRLRTKEGRTIESSRIGSTHAKDVTNGAIDIYRVGSGGVDLGTIYLCPYHRKNSEKAPEGFYLA